MHLLVAFYDPLGGGGGFYYSAPNEAYEINFSFVSIFSNYCILISRQTKHGQDALPTTYFLTAVEMVISFRVLQHITGVQICSVLLQRIQPWEKRGKINYQSTQQQIQAEGASVG